MLLTKEVEVKIRNNDIKYYENLGYEIPKKKASESYYKRHKQELMYDLSKPIIVKVEDLTKGSHAVVQVLCDYCNKTIVDIPYYKYIYELECVDKIACKNCKGKKQIDCNLLKHGVRSTSELDLVKGKVKDSNLLKYGVDNYAKTKECHEKMKNTMLKKYGVEHNSQLPDYREKFHNTCTERYGEFYSKQFVEKALDTFYNKTGYKYPSQSPEIREKITQSYIDKYGVDNPNKSSKVREKTAKTLYANSSQKTSKQQSYIYNLYKLVTNVIYLNYPISSFNADICLPLEKLDIEYDGGFHDGQVKMGNITQEEFNHKELIRDKVIKSEGYKVIRVKSKFDKLPSDQILLQMLQDAHNYFSTHPEHSWIEFNIDTSSIRNAEHKDGIYYDFGELRTIKDNDINTIKDSEPNINTPRKEDDNNENVLW